MAFGDCVGLLELLEDLVLEMADEYMRRVSLLILYNARHGG